MKPYPRKTDNYYDLQNQFLDMVAEVKREGLMAEFAVYCNVALTTMKRFAYTSTACPGRQLCRRALRFREEPDWVDKLRKIKVPKRINARSTPAAYPFSKEDKYYALKTIKTFCALNECGHRCPYSKHNYDCRCGGNKYPKNWTDYDLKKMAGLLPKKEVKNDT